MHNGAFASIFRRTKAYSFCETMNRKARMTSRRFCVTDITRRDLEEALELAIELMDPRREMVRCFSGSKGDRLSEMGEDSGEDGIIGRICLWDRL